MLRVDRVKSLLNERFLTRKWVADACAVSIGTVNQWLSGHKQPSAPTLKLLAQGFQVPLNDLWSGPLPDALAGRTDQEQ